MATTDKYDRQLRLWGKNGQQALGETCIVLIHATAAGTETLKNLVLPGIGAMYIVDDAEVSSRDASCNFFVTLSTTTATTATTSRAQATCESLQELNPDVRGKWKHIASPSSLEGFEYDDWKQLLVEEITCCCKNGTGIRNFIVVASDFVPTRQRLLSSVCDALQIPLVLVHSYGLMGYTRIQCPLLPLYNPKPDHTLPDLRLSVYSSTANNDKEPTVVSKFHNDLYTLVDTVLGTDRTKLDNQVHSHIPYPLLLLQFQKEFFCLQNNKNEEQSSLPVLKQQFRSYVQQQSRNFHNELNFQEAVTNSYLVFTGKTIDTDRITELEQTCRFYLQSVVAADNTTTINTYYYHQCLFFYLLILALQEFLKQSEQQLPPLNGTIPDMVSSSDSYIQLQTLYKQKAQDDRDCLKQILLETILVQWIQQEQQDNTNNKSIFLLPDKSATCIQDYVHKHLFLQTKENNNDAYLDEILDIFCKNVYDLDVYDTSSNTISSIEKEYNHYCNRGGNTTTTTTTTTTTSADDNKEDMNALFDNTIPEDILEEVTMSTYDPYEIPVHTPVLWYFGIRSCFIFYEQYHRYPGSSSSSSTTEENKKVDDDLFLKDVLLLQDILTKLISVWNLTENEFIQEHLLVTPNDDDDDNNNNRDDTTTNKKEYSDIAYEFTRYNHCEIHAIASYIGGVASQEIVKIITGQYIPMNNTFIYNGIASVNGAYKF